MKWTTDKLRAKWLEFFQSKGHYLLPTASLVPKDDRSLLWINSGVANLKPYFEGKQTPPAPRLVNSQKAIRTNDIENVGLTARHHTFFEMLGNFSIGDYFKKEAIIWAWEFLTNKNWLHLNPEKLYVTVFSEDQETSQIWLNEIKIPKDHLILGSRTTNFWDMGQGPCGPNTEIYYDRGTKYDQDQIGLKLLQDDIENDRYIEIWNIVFSQYNNDGFNNYTDLPRKNIDTGAGLERIVAVLQDVPTNFDTDLFQAIIKKCQTFSQYHYDINNYFTNEPKQTAINTAFKIISDHIRCLTFAIADGVFPSNKTRGYILRRLIRRAEIYGQKLGINKPFLYLLVPTVIEQMAAYYQELKTKGQLIVNVIKNEEIKFWQTLVAGKELLLKIIHENRTISGANAFKLFDTFGFPIELTQELAQENKVDVDLESFYSLLNQHKVNARNAQGEIKALAEQNPLLVNLSLKSNFVGYQQERLDNSKIILLFKTDNQEVQSLENTNGYLILDQTPFYAERGGQAADTGEITGENGYAHVLDVQAVNNFNIHYLEVIGKLSKNELVIAKINQLKRYYTRKNHSGTHLLHAALRMILGSHVMQSGSFNNEQSLRLDFSHFTTVTENQIIELETQVQQWIAAAVPAEVFHLTHDEALKLGALAFFGEKYQQIVRVVKFGDFSIELCGGTHCANSQEVEDLLITSVESKGSGSYRIQALTSFKTIKAFLNQEMKQMKQVSDNFASFYQQHRKLKADSKLEQQLTIFTKFSATKTDWRMAKKLLPELQEQYRKWKKVIDERLEQDQAQAFLHLKPIISNDGKNLLIQQFQNFNLNVLKNLSDYYRNRYQDLIIIFLNQIADNNETLILVAISKTLVAENYDAKAILMTVLQSFPGQGGGTNLLSQGKIQGIISSEQVIPYFVKPETVQESEIKNG